MGVTVAYRGRLADLTRIEDFEDRLLDFALEVGGLAQIWRTHADTDPQRMVRGIILNLAPGLEPTSMLVSPEGWLIGLIDIKDAELGRLTEAPWCFTKTQFGPLEGHVALVEMLTALRNEFVPDLEVSDEGGYYATRDLAELTRRRGTVQQGIEEMAEGLQRHGLSREAAEDPDILLRHIERIADRAHRLLRRPAEHPPVTFPEEDLIIPPSPEATEKAWDEMFKHNRRQQERLQRSLEERRASGEEDEEAFEKALGDLGLEPPEPADEPWDEEEPFAEPSGDIDLGDEEGQADEEDEPFGGAKERHPLLERATDLLMSLHEVFRNVDKQFEPSLHTLYQGAGDVVGGLAQALSRREMDEELNPYGLRVVQLKRALRGAAFACGALSPLRPAVSPEQFKELRDALRQVEKDVFGELARLRAEHQAEEPPKG
jgi:hypothetical protein